MNSNNFVLYLIRHGESEVNVQPDIVGQLTNVPLTDKGRFQAEELNNYFLSKKIFFDFIFSSTYLRAVDTAYIASKDQKAGIVFSEELREYSAGSWTGASRSEVMTESIKLSMASLNKLFLPPNGESMSMVERRASQWLENQIIYNQEILNCANSKKDPVKIAVFSHGMTIKCLLHYIMGFDATLTHKINIENTSITKLAFNKNGWYIVSINECPHLS